MMFRHVDADIQELKQLILSMAGSVERQLVQVCQALFQKDSAQLEEVHRQEEKVNELQIAVDEACLRLLAKQAPLARDLRTVIAVIKLNTDLERMGDQVVNIAHSTKDLSNLGRLVAVPQELLAMAERVRSMLRDSLDAFTRQDTALAEAVLLRDDEVDRLRDEVVAKTLERMQATPSEVPGLIELIMIGRNFERLADHSTNIAEEVIFLATGDDVRHGHGQEGE